MRGEKLFCIIFLINRIFIKFRMHSIIKSDPISYQHVDLHWGPKNALVISIRDISASNWYSFFPCISWFFIYYQTFHAFIHLIKSGTNIPILQSKSDCVILEYMNLLVSKCANVIYNVFFFKLFLLKDL